MSGEESKDVQKHYLFVDDLVYYLSNVDDDPCMRLFVPRHLKTYVVKQYHDKNGHMGVQKTFDSIRQKYYWPNLFKERTSDSHNEVLPMKMTREKFQRKLYFFYEKDSRSNPRLIHKSCFLIGKVPIEKYGLKTLFLLFNI